MQSRPGNNDHLIEKDINQSREPVKGGRGTMLPPDAESTLPTYKAKEHRVGGRGTMLPPEDDENTIPTHTQTREPVKGGRGTMLPPDAESTDPPGSHGGVISGGPNDRISDSGLTSQSFGTNDTQDHHQHQYHELNVGGQETETGPELQRLPSYEVHNSQEHKERGLRKASVNLQGARDGTIEPAEPEDFEDEAFTTGLLTKNYKEATNIGTDKDFPVSSEDAFADLTHPMRKHSSIDRPFLNIDDEPEHVKTDNVKTEGTQSKGGFTGQPIITAKGQPNLKSDIDDQPSPISSTEKYTKETSQTEVEPMKPSNTVGQENIVREASQGNETKKQKKFTSEPVDKENVRATTAI